MHVLPDSWNLEKITRLDIDSHSTGSLSGKFKVFFCYTKTEPTAKTKTKAFCLFMDSAIPIPVEFPNIAVITPLGGKEVLIFAFSQPTNQRLKKLRACLLYQIYMSSKVAR